jgi:hypothetical protein
MRSAAAKQAPLARPPRRGDFSWTTGPGIDYFVMAITSLEAIIRQYHSR